MNAFTRTIKLFNMKLNWGHYIIIAYVLFAAMLTHFMIKGARNQNDLVTADYYNQEVKYQQRIDDVQRAEILGAIELIRTADGLCIQFPEGIDASATGELHLYKPDNAKLDLVQPINLNETAQHCISASQIASGLWSVKASATIGGQSYYWEESIFW
jgi:hypothetical protein